MNSFRCEDDLPFITRSALVSGSCSLLPVHQNSTNFNWITDWQGGSSFLPTQRYKCTVYSFRSTRSDWPLSLPSGLKRSIGFKALETIRWAWLFLLWWPDWLTSGFGLNRPRLDLNFTGAIDRSWVTHSAPHRWRWSARPRFILADALRFTGATRFRFLANSSVARLIWLSI